MSMTGSEHARLRQLILGIEELEGPDRAEAEAHLAACEVCAALLASLRRIEQGAATHGALPALEIPQAFESNEERAAATSLAALRDEIEGVRTRRRALPVPRASRALALRDFLFGSRGRRVATALLSAAAVILVLIVRPHAPPTDGVPLAAVEVVRLSTFRGPVDPGFHAGDAFGLEIELGEPAYPLVVHVDPEGGVGLLIPPEGGAWELAPRGQSRLPSEAGGIEWRLEGRTGSESFLVAAVRHRHLDPEAFAGELRGLPGGTRDARLEALRQHIERRVGPVRLIELDHLP
jgi:hypothetical protein